MNETKYNLKLTGIVSDGKYSKTFTEKNVDYIEFSFGDKKIKIGNKMEHALKLQELVKEYKLTSHINTIRRRLNKCDLDSGERRELMAVLDYLKKLQSLVEESEK